MSINPIKNLQPYLFSITVLVTLIYGWSQRDNNYISAEEGIGYALGIIGGSLLIVLLLYPLSKRVSVLIRYIPIRYWFGIHMFLGTVGPVLILFHSNFHMGSTNSTVALISMLLVAGSGVIGRYIYTNIHHGLYGARLTLKELKKKTEEDHDALLKLYASNGKLSAKFENMEKKALQPYTSLMKSLFHVIYLAVNSPSIKRQVLQLLESNLKESYKYRTMPDKKVVSNLINHYTLTLRQTAALTVYERLFSLWHILHLPLFFMMLITAVVHIFAVHIY